jgi:hypothetical protein
MKGGNPPESKGSKLAEPTGGAKKSSKKASKKGSKKMKGVDPTKSSTGGAKKASKKASKKGSKKSSKKH